MQKYKLFLTLILGCLVWLGASGVVHAQTSNTQSGSVGVEGKVPGDPPSVPATITTPGNGQTFTSTPITVAGICKGDVTVKVFKNNVFAGSTQCRNGSYSLQIDLFNGTNEITVRISDALEQEGPVSQAVTVTYNDNRYGGTGSRISLTSNYSKRGANPGETLTWPIIVTGGTGPYAISVDWGDGKTSLVSQQFPGVVNLTHVYDSPGSYNIIVKATDKNGDAAFLQLVGIANGAISETAKAQGGNKDNAKAPSVSITSRIPVIVLATFTIGMGITSFWLGGRHALLNLRKKLESGRGGLY